MVDKVERAVAVVGLGAVLPDAPDAPTYWENLKAGRYSISEVPTERWNPDLYFDPDPKAEDKTYSTIGGWVRDFDWAPLDWRLPIPPKVAESMDLTQKWSVMASREALLDYGYPDRPLDGDRTAVILGNAMAGDMHYQTSMRAYFPEYAEELTNAPSFQGLSDETRQTIVAEMHDGVRRRFPHITEDTMPGELGNIIAGRVANLFNFHGPNFVVDAACASALAAIDAAIEGLEHGDYDAVITGGVDANMGVPSFIKFCKIGALSATGTRPYHEGADGFVMGEGAAVFLLKRLADAERDGDHIYAVIRGLGGSSDGKGKGITAPNPVGQEFAVARAWRNANLTPNESTYIEGHGTSTRVGDVVEVTSLSKVFKDLAIEPGSIPLGSVKSNIGHLKSSAGAAGMLKAVKALDEKVIPPSLGDSGPNPNIDFADSPLFINKELREWDAQPGQIRTAGVSAFGFGGTNFHVVLEEYIPGRLQVNGQKTTAVPEPADTSRVAGDELKDPLRGALVIGGATHAAVLERLRPIVAAAHAGTAPPPAPPAESDLRSAVRLAIDYGSAEELAAKGDRAIGAFESENPAAWKALRNRGVFLGEGGPELVAFLYTGQGSQYVNMLNNLRDQEPIVTEMFAEADRIMEPVLGSPLSDYIFANAEDKEAMQAADAELRQTEITQPAVLAVDAALTELLNAYGIHPDMVMGHSLGEYGALVAAKALPFEDALEAVAGRGREMAHVEVEDNGRMTAVFAPLEDIQRVVDEVEDYVVIANINSFQQAVIGGSTPGVEEASRRLKEGGAQVIPLPVSHAFHTEIVAPASEPLEELLTRLRLTSPAIPLVANTDGQFYPMGPNVVDKMIDILGDQIASPVQFVTGLQTLYEAGCRTFVEVGPKKALHGLVENVLGEDPEVTALFTNHPKLGDIASFNQGLCGLYAAGLGVGTRPAAEPKPAAPAPQSEAAAMTSAAPVAQTAPPVATVAATPVAGGDVVQELGQVFADFLAKGYEIYSGGQGAPQSTAAAGTGHIAPYAEHPIVITGAGLGLPGGKRVFGDDKIPSLLHGEQMIDTIPMKIRQRVVDKRINRLVKSEAGGGHFEAIDSAADVVKLAGRGGEVDLVEEFGFPAERVPALDRTTILAIGAGIDAMRDAGIPLAMHYKDTTTGTKLPERWMLPQAYRDTTGVIFASAFPGTGAAMREVEKFYEAEIIKERLADYKALQARLAELGGSALLAEDLQHRIHELEHKLETEPYNFDRRFLFRGLSMGHSQMAEYIGARGPNTQVNAACASTTQAVALAEDWIRTGRAERVIVVASDDLTADHMLEWFASGFLAVGAAATDELVEDAAVPFDRRRHGMIIGMGAAAIVVEHPDSAAARGIQPISEVLASAVANSAYHGSRLDPAHIREVMEDLITDAEQRWGINRHEIAAKTVFVSHETYTPARGGSAQAEIDSLRHVFGHSADSIVIANTKGYTGHAMGAGVEDILAIKSLETGIVPPVPNFKEPDPELGNLNLSRGGSYPIQYALRLGAGFGSQISMTLYRHVPSLSGLHPEPDELGFESRLVDQQRWTEWLTDMTGLDEPQIEVDRRTLRVRDTGAPARAPLAAEPRSAQPRRAATAAATPAATMTTPPPAPATAPAAVAPAPAPAVEEAPAAAPAAPEPIADPVVTRVLEIVAGQTGYPPDMLDLDLDLEADLGVDTVKQAETFAAIRDEYNIERDDNLALRDYPTLEHVIGFVRERRPDLAGTATPVAPATAAPTPTAAAPATAPAETGDPVAAKVLEIVAGQTGYPPDMLDLDLDLEADLGVDTVKQAETFAAIRDEYNIERDDNLALRDYPTLEHVIGFVRERRPDLAGTAAPAAPSAVVGSAETATTVAETTPAPAALDTATDPVAAKVLEIVAGQTGYPPDMLDLDLDLEADLGVDTVKQAETFAAIRDEYNIERDDNLALRDYPTLEHVIGFVRERRPDLAAPAVTAAVVEPAQPPAAAAEAPADTADPVTAKVLEIVAGQTGYPPDMLDLDLDLEADLGVDTVKQAETFAAIRDEYDIERDDNLALRDYPTLEHVIGFVRERRPDLAAPAVTAAVVEPAQPPAAAAEAPADTADPVTAKVLEIVAGQTGYPPDMLDLDLDLEADLGVDTVKQAETFAAIRDEYDIERDDNLALRDYPTLEHVIGFVRERRPDLAAPAVTAAVVEPAQPPAAAAEAPADTADPVTAKVLEIVAGQTGYPPDMLDLDLDLEADLGVDTVKQAETFAAIRDEYNIERDDNLALRDYPTLEHVIGFVRERRPDLAAPATPAAPAATATHVAPEAEPAASQPMVGDDAAAAEVPRRIPTPVLRPSLDVCVPTGISLDDDSRVVVMLDQGGVGAALVKRLESESVQVLAIDDAPEAAELRNRLDEFGQDGAITGVYWLRALDVEPSMTDLDLDGWRSELRERVKLLYETMRHLYDTVGSAGTFLVSGTRLGGKHGYGPNGASAPMGGAVTGFTKAYKREKGAAALVKAVDFAPSRKTAALADKLIAETLRDPGVVEVGYSDDHRWAISLTEIAFGDESPGLTLDSDSVFVVTGAAGSIVSAITADLARASGGTFHLLDLIPEPDKSDPDLAAFATDRDGLKRQIFDRLKESGERATPAMVEKELAGLERSHAALAAIEAVEAAGGTVHYHSVNLLDHDAVAAAMQHVSEHSDKVDVLLHAGGLEISRHLPDKERSEFDLVFDVKADGWFSLISGLGDTPIASTVVFSSVAGRFGNDGQTDYSSANDLLCKFTASQRAGDATTLGVAIDWTAWGDIGMATRGSIPTVMAAAGIDMLPAAAGIPIVRRELTKRAEGGEVVIGLRLGLLLDEFDETGGLDLAAPALGDGPERSIMTGSIDRFALYGGLRVSTTLDPTEQPFLFDHRIDGTPVLPGVMGVEAFAAAACLAYPDRKLAAIENVDFLAPFKFYRDEPRTVQVEVQYTTDGDDIVGRCELIGERVLAGQTEPVRTVHFRGDVRLSSSPAELAAGQIPQDGASAVSADSIYQIYFHGPAYQVMETADHGGDTVAGRMATDLPPNSAPADAGLVTSPRLTELAFQTAGVYEIGTSGVMALPAHIERVVYRSDAAEAGAVALVAGTDGGFDALVVDDSGNGLVEMTGYRTVQMPVPIDESLVAPLQTAMTVED